MAEDRNPTELKSPHHPFCKITLLIRTSEDTWPRPDKTDWQALTDHDSPIFVLDSEFLTQLDAVAEHGWDPSERSW